MTVIVVGKPSAQSDEAVARFLERFLERQHPGTAWRVLSPPRETTTEGSTR